MRTSDPAAYTDIAVVDVASPGTAFTQPFRGLLISAVTAGSNIYEITTVAGETRSLTIYLIANQTILLPIAGTGIQRTGGTVTNWIVNALI